MNDLRAYELHAKLDAHRRKVDAAREILTRAAQFGPMVVSMSWGKDSCAMGHLAIETLGRVEMMHLASSYEMPGGERVREYFSERATVHEVASRRTLEETIAWLREVGLPHERSAEEQSTAVQSLKKDPGRAWCAERGVAVQALGMRAEESNGRRRLFRVRGATYQLTGGIWVACPLAWWTARDVWAYLVSRGVPWHPLYDYEDCGLTREWIRNTGWLSTDGAAKGRLVWLRKHYPEQWERLATEFQDVRRFT